MAEVDRDFWLQWAGDAVKAAPEVRAKAAERLTATVGWFWTVYTAAALVGTGLLDRDLSTLEVAAILVPIILLAVAYLSAIWATHPKHVEFDPRNATEIEATYASIDRSRRHRIVGASIATVVAALSVLLAVSVTALSARVSELKIAVELTDQPQNAILVAFGGLEADSATISLSRLDGGGEVLLSKRLTIPSASETQLTLPLDPQAGEYEVSISWSDDAGVAHTAARTLEVKERPATQRTQSEE